MNCATVIVFGDQGWRHREPRSDCAHVAVAWPPSAPDDESISDAD